MRISYDGQFIRLCPIEFLLPDGYRALSMNGRILFTFTIAQSQIIEVLILHLKQGIDKVPQETVLCRISEKATNGRLRDYFRDHPAWGTLIKTTGGRDASVYLDFNCLN